MIRDWIHPRKGREDGGTRSRFVMSGTIRARTGTFEGTTLSRSQGSRRLAMGKEESARNLCLFPLGENSHLPASI